MEHMETKSASKGERKPLLHYYDRSKPVSKARSKTMSKIRGKDTKPELQLRKALHAKGLRYRVHDKTLPGTPDISNKSRKVAVFVDGCFWHGCPQHFKVPKTRSEFWEEKIRRNRETRHHVLHSYPRAWNVIQVYECEVKDDCATTIQKIEMLFGDVSGRI